MRKFLALAALVLGLASCQNEPEGLNIVTGGEVDTVVTVAIPETETRTAPVAGTSSAVSAFSDLIALDAYTARYIFEIYYDGTMVERQVKYVDAESTSFRVRLIPNRDYQFVVWTDIVVKEGTVDGVVSNDLHYVIGETLRDITLSNNPATWVAMDESRDAFTATYPAIDFNGAQSINIDLYRPFAKLRVVTTDYDDIQKLNNTQPTYAKVEYKTPHYTSFNAFDGTPGDAEMGVTHDYEIAVYTSEDDTSRTIFSDYFFAVDGDIVNFILTAYDQRGAEDDYKIKSTTFNTPISVRPNYLTTLTGNVLTDGSDIGVTVKPGINGGEEDAYNHKVVTSGKELLNAIAEGGEYIIGNDITINPGAFTQAATRAVEDTIVLNLNGYTITVNTNISINNKSLIIAGEGSIDTDDVGTIAGGDIVVTGSAEVESNVATVKTGLDALVYICENGGEFNFTENLDATDDVLLVSTTNPVVINGNNFNLTTSANRIVRITKSNAVVTFNDVNFISSAVMIYPSDVRGVSVDAELSNVALTLNNCSIDFTDKTTNDWTYAVNVSGNGTGHNVTVNGGTYEGANVVNAHGAKNTIVVKNATLNCLYPNNDQYYGACIWVKQEQGSSVYAEGNTFNGNNAIAFNLGTGTELVENNNTDNTKYVAAKVGNAYYYNIAEAIAATEADAEIKVLQSHYCNATAKVKAGLNVTLNLNGKTITGTDSATGSYAIITNHGNLTITGEGKMTLKAENNREWNAYSSVISNTVGGKLVVENGTIEHLGGTDMAYGIDNLTNGKGTYAETVINGGTIKSTYRAVRMFLNGIKAQNLLTVNGGTIEGANKSIWMQDPSKNANTGTLVVNEGAKLNGDVYLFVTAGSTEWPVKVSIAASAVNGEVLTGNVPAGYEVVNKGGIWTVIGYTEVSTADQLIEALEANKSVRFKNDIKIEPAAMSNAYGTTGINVKYGQTIDGAGYTLNIKGAGGTWDSGINTTGGLIKNLTVTGSFRGIFINHTSDHSEKVVLEHVTVDGNGTVYTISCDQGLYQGIEATNCTFNGWTSFAKTAGEAKFVNCNFGEGSGYKYCRPYSNTEFVGCTFCPGYAVDTTRATITFTDCTWEE